MKFMGYNAALYVSAVRKTEGTQRKADNPPQGVPCLLQPLQGTSVKLNFNTTSVFHLC